MARKKILWFCSWYPDKSQPFNGDFVQRHARAAALFNDIYVIHVSGDRDLKEENIVHRVNEQEGLTEHLVYFKRVRSVFRKFVTYNRWNSSYRRAVKSFTDKFGKPDLVHVHVPVPDGLIAVRLKRALKIPFVVTEHWTIYQPENEIPYEKRRKVFRVITKRIVSNCSRLLPVSRNLGQLINKLVAPKEFTVIENAANTEWFFYQEQPEAGIFRFIHVSTLSYQKNVEALIDAFVRLQETRKNIELIVIGEPGKELKELVGTTGLDNKKIFLRGEISYPEVARELQQAHAMVMFSRFENSPCSIIEALCCGVPVIAPSIGGIPELIDESNGILIRPMDKENLIESMNKMCNDYYAYDRAMIAKRAEKRFSYTSIGKNLDEVYNQVLERK